MDYAAELSGPAAEGAPLPVVAPGDIEAIVATWTGVPVERMSEAETDKLATLVGSSCGYCAVLLSYVRGNLAAMAPCQQR